MKKRYIAMFAAAGICVWLSGIYTGYIVYGNKNVNENEISEKTAENNGNVQAEQVSSVTEKILPITKIVYRYYYSDGNEEVKESDAPVFLLGKSREETEKVMPEWTIESFSEKKVVMSRKTEAENNEHYIVSSYDGYVAAFLETAEEGNLIELTSTPVSSLMPDEQETINRGIILNSRYELSRCMENYSS